MSDARDASPHPPADSPAPPFSAAGAPAAASAAGGPEIAEARLDPDGLKVIARLRQFGHTAYFVGGCVRDLLLGRRPKDFDIATAAHPAEIRSIFRNCRLIGRRFRLAHVYFRGGKIIEVATFRATPLPPEGNGDDGDLLITEDNVFGTAEQDARRRDFTVNGLFYDVALGRVVDYVGGKSDLAGRVIRTIGDPEVRLREDPVRLLRAVRFAARLDFEIDPATYAAMEGSVEEIPRCAPARLLEDTMRLLRGGAARRSFELLRALGALRLLVPPVDGFMSRDPESERLVLAYLGMLDQRTPPDRPHSDALLLAGLLAPMTPDRPAAGQAAPPSEAADALLYEMVRAARMPRRVAEGARMLLRAQAVLAGERPRRGLLATVRHAPYFADALALFEIRSAVSGTENAMITRWREGREMEIVPAGESHGRRRRRRRRRRGAAPARAAT